MGPGAARALTSNIVDSPSTSAATWSSVRERISLRTRGLPLASSLAAAAAAERRERWGGASGGVGAAATWPRALLGSGKRPAGAPTCGSQGCQEQQRREGEERGPHVDAEVRWGRAPV